MLPGIIHVGEPSLGDTGGEMVEGWALAARICESRGSAFLHSTLELQKQELFANLLNIKLQDRQFGL